MHDCKQHVHYIINIHFLCWPEHIKRYWYLICMFVCIYVYGTPQKNHLNSFSLIFTIKNLHILGTMLFKKKTGFVNILHWILTVLEILEISLSIISISFRTIETPQMVLKLMETMEIVVFKKVQNHQDYGDLPCGV